MFVENKLLDPIFKSFDNTEILKQFDGTNNYINCTSNGSNVYYRKDFIYNNKIYSTVIDEFENDIINVEFGHEDITYEDPRYINDNELSLTKLYRYDYEQIAHKTVPVVYNIKTKEITKFDLEQTRWEKNWIFYKNYIIYGLDPYVIFDRNKVPIFSKFYNFKYWKETWESPRLSCNPFVVNNQYYLLFHSKLNYNTPNRSYVNGLILMNKDMTLNGYYKNPFNIDIMVNNNYTSLMKRIYDWKKITNYPAIHCKLHYFTSVVVDDNNLYLYGGKHDCQSIKVTISKEEFLNKLSKEEFISF